MKNKSLIIILALLVAVIAAAAYLYPKLSESYSPSPKKEQASNTSEKSQTADFTVYDMKGNEVKLSDFFGKPIVVNFWATWCGPCRSELSAFDKAYQEYKGDVAFLMVNLTDGGRDTKESVKSFIEESGYSFPVYLDLDYNASNTYGINPIPETLFINADGTLNDTRVGAMSENELENYIKNMIGE